MSIVFNSKSNQFYLHTLNTTYIIEMFLGEIPLHAYWGKTLHDLPSMQEWQTQLIPNPIETTVGNVRCAKMLPQECASFGLGDQREASLILSGADGNRTFNFVYFDHSIINGKPSLDGLPSSYSEDTEVDTLIIRLRDKQTALELELMYSVFAKVDVITRSMRIVNSGESTVKLNRIASACVDFYNGKNKELLHLYGAWARERTEQRVPLMNGVQKVASNFGTSSHAHAPFMALVDKNTNETQGEVYGFSLVYSGNFEAIVDMSPSDSVRAMIGINSTDFGWQLKPGGTFQTPEAVLVYSDKGIGEMSRRFHRFFRRNLCRKNFRDEPRPVLVNNWEATYFNFDEQKLLEIARKAKSVDIDMLVLDDGWFGKRNDEHSSLGDWVCNTQKLPSGLKGLGDKLNEIGLKFGLWLEPEMISPDSDLYREHPDWCIHAPNRPRGEERWQLVLDLSRDDVCDYLIDSVSKVLESAPIDYVKWDCNRTFSELGSPKLSPECQQEQAHRYVLGLYRVLDILTSRFPNVLFEGCAAGGGRFDPGILYYMPQIWTSDNTDAVERLYIQHGTSIIYPPITMGAHVSVCPNHQTRRTVPMKMRGNVAIVGQLGYELDLTTLSNEDLTVISEQVAFYKKYRTVVQQGDMYRLLSPYDSPVVAWEFEKDGTVLLCTFVQKGKPNTYAVPICLQGLEPDATYIQQDTGKEYSGEFLMQVGIYCLHTVDYQSEIMVFCKKSF